MFWGGEALNVRPLKENLFAASGILKLLKNINDQKLNFPNERVEYYEVEDSVAETDESANGDCGLVMGCGVHWTT